MTKEGKKTDSLWFGKKFWSVLTLIFLLVGLLVFIFISQVTKLENEREIYIAQLEKELLEGNERYAKAMSEISGTLYAKGAQKDAVYVLKDVIGKTEDDDKMPYLADVRCALTQALGVYASNTAYVPIQSISHEYGVAGLSLSQEKNRLAVKDEINRYWIYDTSDMSEIAVINDVASEYESFWIGDRFFYLDIDRDISMCDEQGNKYLVEEGDYSYLGYLVDRNLYAYAHREIIVISPENGKVLKRFVTPEINRYTDVESIYLTTEFIYVVASSAADSQLLAYTPEGDFVGRYPLSDIESGLCFADGSRFYYMTSYKDGMRYLACFDTQQKKELWRFPLATFEIRNIKLYEGDDEKAILVVGTNDFYALNEDGLCLCEQTYEQQILSVLTKEKSNSVRVLLNDNTYQLISATDWEGAKHSFFDKQPSLKADAVAVTSDSVFVHFEGEKQLRRYGVSNNLASEYLDVFREGVVNKAGTLQMVCNDNEAAREFILYDFISGEEKVRLEGEYRTFAFVGDGSEYFILYGSTLDVCSVEDARVIYSFDNASFPLFSADYDAVYLPKNGNAVYYLPTGKKVGTMMNKADAGVLNLVLGKGGKTYALLAEDEKQLLIYETKTQKLLLQKEISLVHAKEVFFSADGEMLGILTEDKSVQLYDAKTLELKQALYHLEEIGIQADLWFEPTIQEYILDTTERDYVLDKNGKILADMRGIIAFSKDKRAFLRKEEAGYWYLPYVEYDRILEMGLHVIETYEPEEEILSQYE